LRSVRFNDWRERLAADLVLAIANQTFVERTLVSTVAIVNPNNSRLASTRGNDGLFRAFAAVGLGAVAATEGYKRLPDASFAFFRSAASAPAIRICSTVRLRPFFAGLL
jgi:hypothetical protein